MLIQSLLDTDLYKFTMMQVVLHHFPGAQVEYKFKCRTPGVDLRPHLEDMKSEFADLCKLRFRDDELAYLRGLRFMKSDFVDFLGLFKFNEKYLSAGYGEKPGEIDITIRGPWLHTILYEIPVLAVVSEVYFRRTQPRPQRLARLHVFVGHGAERREVVAHREEHVRGPGEILGHLALERLQHLLLPGA